jgi:OOP family OmpA-OmpF porin
MKKYLYLVLCVLIAPALVTGCGKKDNAVTFNPATNFSAEKMSADKFVQKVDTFVVILDASDSMEKVYIKNKKERKIDTAVHFLNSMFATMPDVEFTAGLRAFGMPDGSYGDNTPILYWLTESERSGIAESLNQVKTGRNHASSLALALNRTADTLVAVDSRPGLDGRTLANVGVDATDKGFKANRGKIAVIVVSDGIDSPAKSLAAAKHLKARYGNRLNLYTVTAGYEENGIESMRALANAGGGFAVRANDLAAAADMQSFVEKIFVSPDADNDEVADVDDKCPGSPAGILANAYGCTPDTDKDGVYDYLDRCPRTPEGLAVNALGCPADTDADGKYDDQDQSPNTPEWLNDLKWGSASPETRYLWFDVNAYEIRPWMYSVLNEYVAFLNIHPKAVLNVQGHASAVGTSNQNKDLSKRRANAAKTYLLNAGVNPSQLNVTFHGTKMPLTDSKTVQGRNLNRRVELAISK